MAPETHGEPLIGAIDQGTSSSRFFVFSARTLRVLAQHQIEIRQIFPNPGWVEEDPTEILRSVEKCMALALEELRGKSYDPSSIRAVGITNQRETTVVWDKRTGRPFGNAIVWMDNRTSDTVETLIASTPNNDKEFLKSKCGLPFSPYFSAVKLRWLLDNKPELKERFWEDNCLFGTIDSWLIWNLTGGVDGGIHVTDVTNASRTMLMDLQTLSWDQELCNFFKIPMNILPEIKSSAEIYGSLKGGPLKGTIISGCLGDQSAALLGHRCLETGQAKNTYGTGCFILYNTGTQPVQSRHGLLTTVAFRLGPERPTYYALEGSVAIAGQAIKWLRDSLGLIKSNSEVEPLAKSVDTSHGVYFVPAFSGLYAPHWNPHARGTLCGLTQSTTKAHIVRAALEAVSYQTKEIIDAMNLDSGGPGLARLNVDGGMTVNRLFLQIQADILGIPVLKPEFQEATVLGAALAAGCAPGVDLFDPDNLPNVAELAHGEAVEISPKNSPDLPKRYHKWRMAIERSKDWNIC